jgi:hypothetical protein
MGFTKIRPVKGAAMGENFVDGGEDNKDTTIEGFCDEYYIEGAGKDNSIAEGHYRYCCYRRLTYKLQCYYRDTDIDVAVLLLETDKGF